MIKRMHKQIAGLEKQLSNEREKCKKIETNLYQRKCQIIGGRGIPLLNRRRTWAPMVTNAENGVELPHSPPIQLLEGSVFGHQIEYTEEQFHSILDLSFSSIYPLPSTYNTTTPDVRRHLTTPVSKSLLKTPKSFLRRPSLSTATAEASPVITYDKVERIKSLETELEELQQFQKLESEE